MVMHAGKLKPRQQVLVRRFKAAKATFSWGVKSPREQGSVCKGQTASRDTITFTCPFWTQALLSLLTTWHGLQKVPNHSALQGHSLSISCYKRLSFAVISFSFSSVFLSVLFSSWGKPLDVNVLRGNSATVERLNPGRNGRLCFVVKGSFCPGSTFRNFWKHSRQAHYLGQFTNTSQGLRKIY